MLIKHKVFFKYTLFNIVKDNRQSVQKLYLVKTIQIKEENQNIDQNNYLKQINILKLSLRAWQRAVQPPLSVASSQSNVGKSSCLRELE